MERMTRAIVRSVTPRPARDALRRAWRRVQRSRRRAKARRGTLNVRFELPIPGRSGTTSRLQIEAPSQFTIPRRLHREGFAGFEPEGLGCLLALLERLDAGAFFDVGANIAPYSLLAAALTPWRVVAFEPMPRVASVARRIRDLNGLDFTLEEIALDETPGELPLYISTSSDTSSSLRSTWRPWERTVTVRVDTLDRYCERTGLWPAVVKIDTETTEPAVLRGGGRLLGAHRPWIICEVLKGHTEAALEEILTPLAYRRYHIGAAGRLEERERLEGETHVFRDWLLAPEPVDDALAKSSERWAGALLACGPATGTPDGSGTGPGG